MFNHIHIDIEVIYIIDIDDDGLGFPDKNPSELSRR